MYKIVALVVFAFALGHKSANATDCSASWAAPESQPSPAAPVNHSKEEAAQAIVNAQKAIIDTGNLGLQVSDLVKSANDNASKILEDKNKRYGKGDVELATSCNDSIKQDSVEIWWKVAMMNAYVQEAAQDYSKAVDPDKPNGTNPQDLLNHAYKRATDVIQFAMKAFNWAQDDKPSAKDVEDKSTFNKIKFENRILQVIASNPNPTATVAVGAETWKNRHREYLLLTAIDRFPSAASLVGTPGVMFSGSSSGGTATITASFEQLGLGYGDRYKSLTLSAPTAKSGNTNLATLDGFESGASLRFNNRFNKPSSLTEIYLFGFAPQIGYQCVFQRN